MSDVLKDLLTGVYQRDLALLEIDKLQEKIKKIQIKDPKELPGFPKPNPYISVKKLASMLEMDPYIISELLNSCIKDPDDIIKEHFENLLAYARLRFDGEFKGKTKYQEAMKRYQTALDNTQRAIDLYTTEISNWKTRLDNAEKDVSVILSTKPTDPNLVKYTKNIRILNGHLRVKKTFYSEAFAQYVSQNTYVPSTPAIKRGRGRPPKNSIKTVVYITEEMRNVFSQMRYSRIKH